MGDAVRVRVFVEIATNLDERGEEGERKWRIAKTQAKVQDFSLQF